MENKQPKCGYCEMIGEKPHCHNCKVFNRAVVHRDPHEIPYSLEEIIEYINNPESAYDDEFRIGDYKTITLYTGEEIQITLVDLDKDTLADGSGRAKATFVTSPLEGRFRMNLQSDNAGGYTASKMRNQYLPRFYALLPEALRNAIKPVNKKTYKPGGEIETSAETIWLLSEIEYYGRTNYSQPGEGETYEWFTERKNRSLPNYTWTRSPCWGGSFCVVHGDDSGCNCASYFGGVFFGFCI